MKVTFILLAVLLILLLAAHLALLLWKERDSLRAAYLRIHGVPTEERARMTDADRRAAALSAKEQENFMSYDGSEQPPIDVEQLLWE